MGFAGITRRVHRRNDSHARHANGTAAPLSVADAVAIRERQLDRDANRVRLVPGFFNVTLTPTLAARAKPALYQNER